jgi:Xaa-Pro aminopeptidase
MARVTERHGPAAEQATAVVERLRSHLARVDVRQALISHPESVTHLSGFAEPIEDWPVANPFVGGPSLVALDRVGATLLIADFFDGHSRDARLPVRSYRSYDIHTPPDPPRELERLVLNSGLEPGRLGVETSTLPARLAGALEAAGYELVPIDELVVESRRHKLPSEIEGIRRASELADIVQTAIAEHA